MGIKMGSKYRMSIVAFIVAFVIGFVIVEFL
ncbi:uncharacterized protein METZ01_LOCUS192923 [marine metagenome]|uniref:Uncharacterized protein n=1 Tax=marine metagenome TaxID=408172 RepID=A0A382DPC2_9ZZZZ